MCENCKNWARTFDNEILVSEHHPDCDLRDIEIEAKLHLENIVAALEHEAKMGDGISDEYWDAYCEAKIFIGDKLPNEDKIA